MSTGILVLDFGSQYTQIIARRVREVGVYCEVYPWDQAENALHSMPQLDGIILSGGPESVHGQDAPTLSQRVLQQGCPLLGICYGMQILCNHFSGAVALSDEREFGPAKISIKTKKGLFAGLPKTLNVWMSHGDRVEQLPEGFECIAASDNAPIAAMQHRERAMYGLQFHPEVTHTEHGEDILRNFLLNICQCQPTWTTEGIVEQQIANIRERVGEEGVLLGLSGGVDSSVAAMLLHRAIGEQLVCVFVDNGLLRLGEGDEVMRVFAEDMGIKVVRADAADEFFFALKGLDNPEAKRKAIGKTFVEVFQRTADELRSSHGGLPWLAQGTIYSDVIESAGASTGKAHVIKSHHNVGGLPEDMNFKLIEPLRNLFKDEVRRVGTSLGLSEHIINRHPFPGPSLGVRILGEVTPEYAEILRRADAIFIEELHQTDWYRRTSQAFVVFLPVKAVGVVGDTRRYAWVVALRAVVTQDFMTAHWARLPEDLLERVATRIINEIEDIARVTYDISNKPPATIEWE